MVSFTRAVPILLLGFLIIAATSLSSCYGNLDVVCVESEKQALLSFKQGLEDPSNRLSSWNVDDDCCKWAGVVCNDLTGHVRELHLQNDFETWAEYHAYKKSMLGGEVNPSLLNLKHLSYLDLSQNDFGGIPIPSFLGSLAKLQYLNLSEAGFAGIVPHQLGNLSSLRSLSLKSSYWLYGDVELEVENLHWLFGLSTLEHLDLSQVNLSKAPNWLQVINMLPSLVELRLSYCGLHRIPPLPYVNFTFLVVLDLSDNEFNSLIPQWISSLSSLISLNLGFNYFKGPIPDGFWNLTSLKMLDVSLNFLNSSLPNWLFSCDNLVSLILRHNGFEGPIPSGLQNMTSLRDLDLSENNFNSRLPDFLYNFRHLELLDLNSNQLQGIISSSIGNLTSIVTLDLSYNELKGRVPREVGNLCNLRSLGLSGIRFGGEVSEFFKNLSRCISHALESLALSDCLLSGHLTDQLGQFKSLQFLALVGNSISGPIPESLGRCTPLIALDLAGNQLNGAIPESLGRCTSLRVLSLAWNQLNGTLPESLGQLSQLEQLIISDNLLEGVVSEVHFANLTSLRELYASKNRLVLKVSRNWIPPFHLEILELRSWNLGKFPMWLHSQKGLRELDLSCTGISNSIPNWFWNLSFHLSYLNLSHNQIHGKIPNILKLDGSFSMIYLGSNRFSGPLPRLSLNATELDLSNNSFSGDIFHFLCDRKDGPNKLEILHLGENFLSGEIPDCWMNWPALKVIKLGNNRLRGNIPSSLGYLRQLQSLHLRNSNLSGEVPLSLENCTELLTIDLGLNQFVGSIPPWSGRSLSNLKILSLRSNNFHGEIPSELCHLTSLQILDLANNNFSGSIPQCFKNFTALAVKQNSSDQIFYSFYGGDFLEDALVVTKGREFQYDTLLPLVASMDLSDNNMSGEIPEELLSLLGLQSLNLSGNHLTGIIPKEIGDMANLESLDLSRNQFYGEIPPSMSVLTFLSYLNMSYNNLSGRIPLSTQLQSLDASSFIGNKLCGPPLPKKCNIDGVPPAPGKGDEEIARSDVELFYLIVGLGFVMGFWSVFGPLLFNKMWRFAYFKFLDEMWSKISNCLSW